MPEEYYKQWNDVYRRGPDGVYPWDLGRPRDFLVRLMEKGMIKGHKALDTCCGLGTNGLYLAGKGFQVTGIDISERAVQIASGKAGEAGKSEDIEFRVENFMEMDFEAESFDFILDIGCFHHVVEDDRTGYIENLHRILGQGGRYLLMCFSERMGKAWNHFSERRIRDLFSSIFKILILEDLSSLEGDGMTRQFLVSLMEKTAG